MFPVCNEGCVISAAGCRWCLEEFRYQLEVDAIAHIRISTLFLHSDYLELTKKHLFDFRYLLLRGRTCPLMNASLLLSPERGDAYRASYPPYSFPGSANDVSVIGGTLV